LSLRRKERLQKSLADDGFCGREDLKRRKRQSSGHVLTIGMSDRESIHEEKEDLGKETRKCTGIRHTFHAQDK
jgi:hypothetical protein